MLDIIKQWAIDFKIQFMLKKQWGIQAKQKQNRARNQEEVRVWQASFSEALFVSRLPGLSVSIFRSYSANQAS